ncbi:hypothetical protein IE53DRAFT_388060 [Violaceomyces palustris]|uniref:Uncharacterized protein n=1 Tax=Violaceomyces palustris TaxID=1673888 RepID=A0ACD0NV34_9BASI|nr:hypothetical protein IE53DRAFT_388060 [Violaceomyces palustris]
MSVPDRITPELSARHIQNFSDADSLEPHWGYADRVIPCTNDPGSCAYLDVVYHSHDLGMLYTGIIWATIGAILLITAITRRVLRKNLNVVNAASIPVSGDVEGQGAPRSSFLASWTAWAKSTTRRYLLPESLRVVFGRTTRLQILILAIISGYLIVWSFVGIAYHTWITPVKNKPGMYNTRTSLGPFADRLGVLAFALTPLSIMLASRESLLSMLTGIPYHHFNFFHRWLGHIIFIQSAVHTIGWCVIEIRLYQPQPTVALNWIRAQYMIWGLVAMILLTLLWLLSLPFAIRTFGYEFFRKSHYVLAMVYIGACWGHWEQLKVFLLPSLLLWFADRLVRLLRTFLLHYRFISEGKMGFQASKAKMRLFPDPTNGDIVRLDFRHAQSPWKIGEHFYLCFTEGSIWQSHPMTPLSLPVSEQGEVLHSYVFRAKQGETKRIAQLARSRNADREEAETGVILTGPYGQSIVDDLEHDTNVLCVAGGTGITFVLPVLLGLSNVSKGRSVELVWSIRCETDREWISEELERIQQSIPEVKISLFVTRQGVHEKLSGGVVSSDKEALFGDEDEASSNKTGKLSLIRGRPGLEEIVEGFVNETRSGKCKVFASGPGGMVTDLRRVVARCNRPDSVRKGDARFDVALITDERLEF